MLLSFTKLVCSMLFPFTKFVFSVVFVSFTYILLLNLFFEYINGKIPPKINKITTSISNSKNKIYVKINEITFAIRILVFMLPFGIIDFFPITILRLNIEAKIGPTNTAKSNVIGLRIRPTKSKIDVNAIKSTAYFVSAVCKDSCFIFLPPLIFL